MLEIKLDIPKTLFFAVCLLVIGRQIRNKIPFLVKFCIPSPVVGGLLFAILNFVLHQMGIVTFQFNNTMEVLFMNIFFTASGFSASVGILKNGGKKTMIFLVLASILAALQNGVAVALSKFVGITPLMSLMTGSIPMTGGHGNAAAFAPIAEKMGATGAVSVAVAAATFGLVSGGLVGGPVARNLITKFNLIKNNNTTNDDNLIELDTTSESTFVQIESKNMLETFILIFLGLGLGAYLMDFSKIVMPGVVLPIHVMGMLGGAIITNILPKFSKRKEKCIPLPEIDIIGDVSLGLFVTMAVMSMKLWDLTSLALPLIVLLMAQVVLMIIFAKFVTFPLLGKDYDAAVMAAGHVGFGLGAVPVSMANMKAVCEEYKYSKLAFIIVPIIGGLFSNFTNAAIITIFMNLFK